jgi:leader peptidase (prepilin peptidase)/N-methyltransferase
MVSDGIPLLAVTIPLAGVVGLFIGSFLNVVIYRTPLGLSVSAPRSFCPTCERQLSWWENIPVVSWLALRGRCHTCHQPISPRYPLVELSTGATFALVTWAWHGHIEAAAYCCLAAAIIAVSLIEYGGQRAPLSVAAIGTASAQLIIVIGGAWQHQWRIVVGSLIGTTLAVAVYATLRASDPDCVDPRGHGRSAVLIAGCWAGGLGAFPLAIGAGVWIGTFFICMAGAWSVSRQHSGAGSSPDATQTLSPIHPILATPLVSAIVAAMAVSLMARG